MARVMIGCANYGSVVAGGQAGGVVGEISCYGSTEEKPVGVMVGCANYGTVEAREWAGGLAGDAEGIKSALAQYASLGANGLDQMKVTTLQQNLDSLIPGLAAVALTLFVCKLLKKNV